METFESDSFVIDFVQHALKAAIQVLHIFLTFDAVINYDYGNTKV